MEAWYVAKTKPRKEQLVETYLANSWEVEVFLPTIRRPLGRKAGWEPLFPTYIFCRVDPQSVDWPAIRWAPGLSYFLCTGQEPLCDLRDDLERHGMVVHPIGGADVAVELDAKRAIDQGARLAARI